MTKYDFHSGGNPENETTTKRNPNMNTIWFLDIKTVYSAYVFSAKKTVFILSM